MEGFKKLKSGALVPCAVVNAVMSDLVRLFCTDPITLRFLIGTAFEPAGTLATPTRVKLTELSYLGPDGRIPEDARQVIISSVTSPDEMHISSPVAG